MTKEHLKSVFQRYIDEFSTNYSAKKMNTSVVKGPYPQWPSKVDILKHCTWMCGEGLRFIENDDIEKAMRWLGFVQGVYFSSQIYSIDELREHSTEPK